MDKPSLGKNKNSYRSSKSVTKADQPTLGSGSSGSQLPKPKSPKQPERHTIPAGLRFEVLQQDNFRCRFCGASANDGAKLEVDHIVPVSRGGTNDRNNLQTLCEKCNIGKSNRVI